MKHTFNPNKINIFTKVPDDHDFNTFYLDIKTLINDPEKLDHDLICSVRNKCIESWKKIPNADIHVFNTQDIKDTFPGMLENDPFYKITALTPDGVTPKVIGISDENIIDFHYDLIPNKERCFSTDIIRHKMASLIPNAMYIDSDIYCFGYEKIIQLLKRAIDEKKTVLLHETQCFFAGSNNTAFYNTIISEYQKFNENYPNCVIFDDNLYNLLKRDKNAILSTLLLDNNNKRTNEVFPNLYHSSRSKLYCFQADLFNYLFNIIQNGKALNVIYLKNYYKNKEKIFKFLNNLNIKQDTIICLQYYRACGVHDGSEIKFIKSKFDIPYNIYIHVADEICTDIIECTDEELLRLIFFKYKTIYNVNNTLNIKLVDLTNI